MTRTKRKQRYLVKVEKTYTRHVYVYDYTADGAKKQALKQAKNGSLAFDTVSEINYTAKSKGDKKTYTKDLYIADLPRGDQKTEKMPKIDVFKDGRSYYQNVDYEELVKEAPDIDPSFGNPNVVNREVA